MNHPSSDIQFRGLPGRDLVSIIVVTYNSEDEIRDCLRSIVEAKSKTSWELIVVDNASRDKSAQVVREEFPVAQLIANKVNVGFAAANNQALPLLRGDYVLLVNPDSRICEGAIDAAVRHMKRQPQCGILGGLLLDEEGQVHPSARRFPNAIRKTLMLSGLREHFKKHRWFQDSDFEWSDFQAPLNVDWVPGAFTLLRRSLIREVGFFDERFYLYYEETDLCLRAKRNGWEVHFIPGSRVVHEGGASSRKHDSEDFDRAGSQVMRFRVLAECLYHRKNHGAFALWSNIGVEWAWHRARAWWNSLPGRRSEGKRRYSETIVRQLESGLRETRFGTVCPPRPW
jgi:GT2 family glycosyltransferase